MRDFDTTIKLLILDSAELLRQLGVEHVTTWLNVELPRVQNRRADLVGKFASGEIVHIEIQSENDPKMRCAWRSMRCLSSGHTSSIRSNWCCTLAMRN